MLRRLRSLLIPLLSLYLAFEAVRLEAAAQPVERATGFLDRVYRDERGEHKYVLFVPHDYTPAKKWPIVLFLHGAYERGEDGRKQVQVGLGPHLKSRAATFPFLVLFPQAKQRPGQSIRRTWNPASPDGKRALKILDEVESRFSVDTKRRILTGWSMGGFGAWQMAAADPDRWSALVPVSGGGKPALAKKLAGVPTWAFHGADDETVKPDETRKLIAALKAAGGRPRYSEAAGMGHYALKFAYDNDALYRWMLHPAPANGRDGRLLVKAGTRTGPRAYENEPFVPAVEIPRAVTLRIGKDALDAISDSIPAAMPANALRGGIRTIHDTTTASGRTFRVMFTGINYNAKLERAHLETTDRGTVRLRLGLRNLRMVIGATYVRGSGRSADAGPITISIGDREPVWLLVEAKPYVERQTIRLKLRSTSFHIPNDNWSVSPPAGVRTRGLGMSRQRVSRGLVSGLYGNKGRIEREIRAAVPTVLKKVESQLTLDSLDGVVGNFWPLPVYRPRVRLVAEQIAVDEAGLSIGMGLTAAAVDPRRAPKRPLRVAAVGAPLSELPASRDLRLHVAAGALEPLTNLLIDADVARVHVNDVPHGAFARFGDRRALAEVIPDVGRLPENAEIWSELILAAPLSLTDAAAGASPAMQFSLPEVIISTAVKLDPSSTTWTPYAEFRFNVSQQAAANMRERSFTRREFEIDWSGRPQAVSSARFASDDSPENRAIDTGKLTELFAECWQAWADSGPVARRKVDDIVVGRSLLRLSTAGWSAPHLFVGFSPPGVKLTNKAESALIYEAKGPGTPWGGPYTLPPGKSHLLRQPYSILFRRRVADRNETFTLPVGSHSEYRVPQAGGAPHIFQARPSSVE